MARGKFVIAFGSTGSGKSVLIEHIRSLFPEFVFVKSYTTRERRTATENESYVFLSKEEFIARKDAGEFVEWAEFSGNLYGTRKQDIEEGLASGSLLIKEMEVQGIRQMLSVIPRSDVKLLFVDAGSWNELEKRARLRGSITEEALMLRKQRYLDEQPFKEQADVIIKNPDGLLEEAKESMVRALQEIQSQVR
jgi:guanylate kinase